MVVPLQLGAGTRVKVAEAFSRRCPLVSTPVGVYGYNVENERELLIADSAHELADACVRMTAPGGSRGNGEQGLVALPRGMELGRYPLCVWSAAEACLRAGS